MDVLARLGAEATGWGTLEFVAVAAAILYLLLAIRQNIACWLFAAISTGIYVFVFYEARLYMESFLNLFYLGMAFYGWYCWRQGRTNSVTTVSTWPWRRHAIAIVGIAVVSLLNGTLLARHTDAAFPYIDSATTWFAIFATFLVARKIFENWWYWLLIDLVSIAIYWQRELPLTSFLFVIYVMMIPFGMRAWRRHLQVAVT